MLTPAMSASRTSVPAVIIEKAVSMQVLLPPFLNRWPFADETTAGFDVLRVIIVGPCANAARGGAAASPAAVPVMTNSRRLILRGIMCPSCRRPCGRRHPAAQHGPRDRASLSDLLTAMDRADYDGVFIAAYALDSETHLPGHDSRRRSHRLQGRRSPPARPAPRAGLPVRGARNLPEAGNTAADWILQDSRRLQCRVAPDAGPARAGRLDRERGQRRAGFLAPRPSRR